MGAVVVFVIGLIGVLLGYVIGKSVGNNNFSKMQVSRNMYKRKFAEVSGELEILKAKIDSGTHVLGFSEGLSVHKPFNAALASSVLHRKVEEDDLKVIEGIGPKAEQLFKTSGILTWKGLSETSVERCNQILNKAGEQFAKYNPGTWPRQARLAYEGKWRDLQVWQQALHGGME